MLFKKRKIIVNNNSKTKFNNNEITLSGNKISYKVNKSSKTVKSGWF